MSSSAGLDSSISTASEDGGFSSQPVTALSESTLLMTTELTTSSSILTSPSTLASTSPDAAEPTFLPLSLPSKANVSSTSTIMVTTMITVLQSFTSTPETSPASTTTIYSPALASSPPLKSWPPQFNGPKGPGPPDAKTAVLITAGITGTFMIFLSIGLLIFFCCWKRHRRLQKAKSVKDTKPVPKQSISQPLTTRDIPPSRPPRPPSPTFGLEKVADLTPSRQEPQQNPIPDNNITLKPPSGRLPPFLVNYAPQRRQQPLPPTSTVTPNVERYPVPVDYKPSSPRLKGHLATLPLTPRRPQHELQKSAIPLMVNKNLRSTTQPYRQPPVHDTEPWQKTEYLPESNLHTKQQVSINEKSSQRSPASIHRWGSPSKSESSDEYYGHMQNSMSSPTFSQPLQPRQQNMNAYQAPSNYTSHTLNSGPTEPEMQSWEAADNLPPLPAFPRPPKAAVRPIELSASNNTRYYSSGYEDHQTGRQSRYQSSPGYADSSIWTDVSVTSFQDSAEGPRKAMNGYTRASSEVLPI